jgi:NAD(P)-dependent dehydrogenase (short-subunit alcohol dehydrogenase family)
VITVLSIAGLVPVRAAPIFSAAQAELVAATRALAMEGGGSGVHVNAVAVGAVELGAETASANLLSHTALKRAAKPAEVAAAVLFLADPANTYTTGHVVVVDGGFAAGYARNF